MSIVNKLASSLNRRDEIPNQVLAKQIIARNDKKAVKELIELLSHKGNDIPNDCIKVLYEIGEKKPALIAAYTKEFAGLLMHKNNRLQWGAMTALGCIAKENPKEIYSSLSKIIVAANSGSVITKDQAVNILITLCSEKKYTDKAFPLLMEQLLNSPTNQLPSYAEKAMSIINEKNKARFVKVLSSRLNDIEKDTKRKRVEKVIKKFN